MRPDRAELLSVRGGVRGACPQAPAIRLRPALRVAQVSPDRTQILVLRDKGFLGLGSCQIAALYDDEANEILGIDGSAETTIYMTAVGRPAGSS